MNRKEIQEEMNRLNELFQEYDNKLKKFPDAYKERQKLRELLNAKKAQILEKGDDLTKLNRGQALKVTNATITPRSKLGFAGKTPGLGAMLNLAPSLAEAVTDETPEAMENLSKNALETAAFSIAPKILGSAATRGLALFELLRSEDAGMSAKEENEFLRRIEERNKLAKEKRYKEKPYLLEPSRSDEKIMQEEEKFQKIKKLLGK